MKKVRVLLADDNKDHLFLIERALNDIPEANFDVSKVENGVEVLDFVFKRGEYESNPRPHLILLDLKMPKLDGFEVLEKLKGDADLRTIPVVVLSSSDRQEDINAAYRLGGNSYVRKPAGPLGLREGLERISTFWTKVASLPETPA